MSAPTEKTPSAPPPTPAFDSVEATRAALAETGYIANTELATALHLSTALSRPLFLEGEAGTGKTAVAQALAQALDLPLVRLQCYEGLDQAAALYDWNVAAQLLELKAETGADLYEDRFLLARPLLQALRHPSGKRAVLLIDEIDRADAAFEAFLLELLSDWQITIPERGTIHATQPPLTLLTANGTREIHDALKRRCFYAFVDFPSRAVELDILRSRLPEVPASLSGQVVDFVQALREEGLFKAPGVAESLDWARALVALDAAVLDPTLVDATLGAVLKYQDDLAAVRGERAQAILNDLDALRRDAQVLF
ncbi:MAG: AAA family ATPase [Alphaproteobacteria bacterium]